MIIKDERNNYYSVKKIIKKCIFSETQKGVFYLHSRIIYDNPIFLNQADDYNVVKEKTLYVSPKGALNFRSNNIDFFNIPIEGDFIITDNGSVASLFARYYKVLANRVELSERYISDSQLDEIRRNSSYDVEFEEKFFYVFIETANCPMEMKKEFRVYKVENIKKVKKFIKNGDRFFLKVPIDSLKKIGTFKVRCGDLLAVYTPPDNIRGLLREIFTVVTKQKTAGVFIDSDKKGTVTYISVKIKTPKIKKGYIGEIDEKDGSGDLCIAVPMDLDENGKKEILIEIPWEIIFNLL
jgi:hypothetical protein